MGAVIMLTERLGEFRKKYESRFEIGFFVLGFVFDAWMVSHPDELIVILQQVFYLVLIAALIHHEILFGLEKWQPTGFTQKFWPYREWALHFFLGTLLNVYSIFYIKSASLLSSLIFLLIMIGLILANELPIVKKSKHVSLKVGLYAICLFSFLSIVFPIILGFIGIIPFSLSVVGTLSILYVHLRLLRKSVQEARVLFHAIFTPVISVVAIFGLFYFLGWIPPVPLSVKEQGVYHLIEKREGRFLLSAEKSSGLFSFFEKTVFHAEPGDKIYFYSQIYSPARISDQIMVHWYRENAANNWESMDKVPVTIKGGREEGFRVFTFKTNYEPGDWKVEVETSTGVEISRFYFQVVAAQIDPTRSFEVIER